MHITLSRELPYKDSALHELELDFDSLTGNDLIQAESSLRRSAPDAPLWGTLHTMHIAARASHVPAEALKGLCAKDFMSVYMAVNNFFGSMMQEDSQPRE